MGPTLSSVDSWGFIKISIQTGSGYTWCENTGESLQPSSSGPFTATLDLTTTSCDLQPDTADARVREHKHVHRQHLGQVTSL